MAQIYKYLGRLIALKLIILKLHIHGSDDVHRERTRQTERRRDERALPLRKYSYMRSVDSVRYVESSFGGDSFYKFTVM